MIMHMAAHWRGAINTCSTTSSPWLPASVQETAAPLCQLIFNPRCIGNALLIYFLGIEKRAMHGNNRQRVCTVRAVPTAQGLSKNPLDQSCLLFCVYPTHGMSYELKRPWVVVNSADVVPRLRILFDHARG